MNIYKKSYYFLYLTASMLTLVGNPVIAQNSENIIEQSNKQDSGSKTAKDNIIPVAAKIAHFTPQLSQIWPTYWPLDQTFIINIEGEGALLISSGEIPSSYTPMANDELPAALRGKAYYQKDGIKNIPQPFYLDYDIGNGQTAVLINVKASEKGDKFFLSNIQSLILHEQFHAYQKSMFSSDESVFIKPTDIRDRTAFAASAEIERRILADAIQMHDRGHQIELIQQYFAMRRLREETNLKNIAIYEKISERNEGTAEFAEQSAHSIINEGADAMLRDLLVTGLQEEIISDGGIFTSSWTRGKSYANGAALAYLIGKYDDGDWQDKIEKGAFLDEHLASLFPSLSASKANILVKAAHDIYGYGAIYSQFYPIIKTSEAKEIKTIDEFFALEPYRIFLDLSSVKEKISAGYSAEGWFILDRNITAISKAHIFNSANKNYSIISENHPVLFGAKQYTILLSKQPSIINHENKRNGEYQLDTLKIMENGVDINIKTPVLVTIESDVMTIKLLE